MKAFLLLGVLIGLAAFVTPSTATAAEDTESDAGTELSPEIGNTAEGHIEQNSDTVASINPKALTALLGGRRKRSAQYDLGYVRRRKRADEKSTDAKTVATLLGRRKRDIDANLAASLAGKGTHQKRSPQDAPEYDVEYRRKRFAQIYFDDEDNDRRKRSAQNNDFSGIFLKREAIDAQALGSLAGGSG